MFRLIDADALKQECVYIDDIPAVTECDIDNAPTIDAQPVKRGKWEYRHADDWMFCTACGTDAEGDCGEPLETDFCPNCGARMDGKGNGNEID